MPDRSQPMSSLPGRPLEREELDAFEASDRYDAVLADDDMDGQFAWNCVLVTDDTVLGAVYDETEETWYCVYGRPREGADLTDAYDAIREDRGSETLFSGAPLSVAEATLNARRGAADAADYEEGDAFECPVCGDHHTVERETPDAGFVDDEGVLAVACPDARHGRIVL